jgi:hypothetical protein
MFGRRTLLAVSFALLAACGGKKDKDTGSTGSAAGSAATGSAATGSAAAGSGSDTGSAAAGSGSDTGSAAAGSGSDTGSAGAGSAGSGSDAGSAAAGSGGDVPFEKLSHDDKVKFMKTKVMPAMKAAFQKFDPKEYANFTCKTCHGKDPQGSKHKMPTKDLPALDFAALKKGEDAKEAKFMADVVKPEMAKLLGEPEMNETNPEGFGCLDCHMQKK